MSSCSRFHKPQQSEAFSDRLKISEDTNKAIDRYDFSVDDEIMSRWTPEEKAYFFEHFVFSFEELEQELGLKLPH